MARFRYSTTFRYSCGEKTTDSGMPMVCLRNNRKSAVTWPLIHASVFSYSLYFVCPISKGA